MKKVILMSLFAATAIASKAQTVVNDSAVTGPAYRNNVYYSLENGTVDTVSATNWDIAFAATASMANTLTASILVNTKIDTLYEATGVAVADFATVTSINSNWTRLLNSDTSWAWGAFRQPTATGPFDYGWAGYNMTSHDVEANRVFVVRNGVNTKKIYITLNSVKKRYIFTYANLDNTGLHTDTLDVTPYEGRNFVYFNLRGDSVVNREPLTANWDLLFTQYHSGYSQGGGVPQLVTGALQNVGVLAAQADKVADTITNYNVYTFNKEINILGSDWKTVDMVNPPYPWIVSDSLVYFIKRTNGDIWKLIFTKFGGSATGKYYFNKQKLYTYTNSVAGVANKVNTSVALYPNPAAQGQAATVVYSLDGTVPAASIAVYDMAGRTVLANNLATQAGLHQYVIPTANLKAGIYIVNVNVAGTQTVQKLVIQ